LTSKPANEKLANVTLFTCRIRGNTENETNRSKGKCGMSSSS